MKSNITFYDDNGPVFAMDHLSDFINEVKKSGLPTVTKRKNKKTYQLFNVPCSFDIETTSYNDNGKKVAWMYIWMFGINGISIYGRTWEDFIFMLNELKAEIGYGYSKRLVCYVHNLAFEFQFMRKYFTFEEVFASNDRKPLYCLTNTGIEFRCSYMLTGTSLEKVGDDLLRHKCDKKVGDLNYDLVRGSKTNLSEEELGYCINDIRVVMCKIKECIEDEGNIGYIPLTKTGYVRRAVKKAVLENKNAKELVQSLTLTSEEYKMAEAAFQGGFTHANALHSGITQEDVVSYDFTSSYPSVMISEFYPMGNGKKVTPKSMQEFAEYMRKYCCMFEIKMSNVKLKPNMGDCPISDSKCLTKGHKVVDNGRIRECDELITTIIDCDFIIYSKFYNFSFEIGTMYIYEKLYLPLPIIECVLQFYNDKTKLKDVIGKEADYQLAKGMLNAIFGMMVMKVIRENIEYIDGLGWSKSASNIEEEIEKYNNSETRFNWFLWGVWITGYARKNLFTGIYECGNDYIYADTDSIKILNASSHIDYIIDYNRTITEKLENCLKHYHLDKSLLSPKTIEGVEKPLGIWDFDGHYERFKTLGAKRYMVEKDKEKVYNEGTEDEFKTKLAITVAGVGKVKGLKYISGLENPFDAFEDGLVIPADDTGKMTHTYIDNEYDVDFIDYQGNEHHINVKSGIYLEKTSFTIGISDYYKDLLSILQMTDEYGII